MPKGFFIAPTATSMLPDDGEAANPPTTAEQGRASAPKATARFIISNNTETVTITYLCQWGDGEWQSVSLPPGEAEEHWCPLDTSGQIPVPRVKFVAEVNGTATKSYRLSPAQVTTGKAGTFGVPTRYAFKTSARGRILDLFKQ